MFFKLKKLNARFVYLFIEFSASAFFSLMFVTTSLYEATVAGLTPVQLILVGTALEVSVFLFEVPTGIVADVYSRRLSIIIGVMITGVAFIAEGSLPTFAAIALCEALWGFGYTFTSGATSAWMVDEVGEARSGGLFLRAAQIENAAGIAGIILAIALGGLDIRLPIL